jgi:prepilin-type N-terminal cleavage/methylation domain-containing protein
MKIQQGGFHLTRTIRMPRLGLTLLELMLVLALLVVIASFAAVAATNLLGERKLRRGAEQVRLAFAEARLEAMRSGRTQMVRCQLGGEQFAIEPLPDPSDLTEAADQIGRGNLALASGGAGAMAAVSSMALAEPAETKSLPEKIQFAIAQTVNSTRQLEALSTAAATGQSLDPDNSSDTTQWSEPILFFSDGTTSTAEVIVRNADARQLAIRLRSLTGDAVVIEL